MWEASITVNGKTIVSSTAYAAQNKLDGIYPAIPHSWNLRQYACRQLGQDRKGRATEPRY